ncbi:MAG: hypothetical protein SFX73_04600 [Kofleriaceae bacterium]|nr:hypothetical protein [Kofleriaceae bacterium]
MGTRYVPRGLLAHTPFASFLIPGLLLGLVVGGTSLACATFAWRRSSAAVHATILAGAALTIWIIALWRAREKTRRDAVMAGPTKRCPDVRQRSCDPYRSFGW